MRERQGLRGPLEGRWVRPGADSPALVLQVRAGSDAVAEFTDPDGDGVVDAVLVIEE